MVDPSPLREEVRRRSPSRGAIDLILLSHGAAGFGGSLRDGVKPWRAPVRQVRTGRRHEPAAARGADVALVAAASVRPRAPHSLGRSARQGSEEEWAGPTPLWGGAGGGRGEGGGGPARVWWGCGVGPKAAAASAAGVRA